MEIRSSPRPYVPFWMWLALSASLLLAFGAFLIKVSMLWRTDPEFSFGILIPFISAYVIWGRKERILALPQSTWAAALAIVALGCVLQIIASMSGTLILSGIALAITIIGSIGFLWGRSVLGLCAGPVALLVLMVPMPSYVVGELAWHLQAMASTISGALLSALGVPVLQDGNLLKLPQYVLEVKEACSGSRSIFALIALALILGLTVRQSWWGRLLLVISAPFLAIIANVVRIVGTGLIAWRWGNVAANESLHAVWGIVVFLIAVFGLVGIQRLLQWTAREPASAY